MITSQTSESFELPTWCLFSKMITSTGIAKSGSSSTATAEDLMENFRVNTVGPILVSQVRKMTNYYLRGCQY